MIKPEFPDYAADTVLPPEESWVAARQLGKFLVGHLRSSYTSNSSHYFHLDDVDEILAGVSEQPDLTGEVVVTMHMTKGTWYANRETVQNTSYTGLRRLNTFIAPYVGINVMHVPARQALLNVALPASPIAARMMEHGHMTTHSGSPYNLVRVMERYNQGDVAFEPRRVQAAAQLSRRIVTEQIKPSYFLLTPEEEEAFLDKHFPYQDVPLTGGGGKTVRIRAARPMTKKPTPEPTPPLQQQKTVVDMRPILTLHLPEDDATG